MRHALPLLVLGALLALGACGVDGPPVAPKDVEERPEPGVRISGTFSAGVTGGSTSIRR